jgi:hypothetical protein
MWRRLPVEWVWGEVVTASISAIESAGSVSLRLSDECFTERPGQPYERRFDDPVDRREGRAVDRI